MKLTSLISGPALAASMMIIATTLSAKATPTEINTISPLAGGGWNTNTQIQAISSSDLLESTSPYFSGLTANNPASTNIVTTQNSGLNDGASIGNGTVFANSAYYAYNDSSNGPGGAKGSLIVGNQLGGGGEVLTFNLNTGAHPLGYSINSVNTIAGWTDHASVADQNYTLQYSLVGAPGVFLPVTSVAYNPNNPTADNPGGGGVATEVSLTNLNLVGVAALKFTFTADPTSAGNGNSGTGLWLQEIDGFGSPTLAVPEPSSWAMIFLALSGLAIVRSRRRFIS